MTCKANLHRGAKLGKIVDRLLQVVKLPHLLNLAPIHVYTGQEEYVSSHCRSTLHKQDGSNSMQTYNVEQEL